MADDVLKYPLIWLRDILGSDDEFIVDASIKKCFTKVVELGLNNLTVAAKQSSLLFAEEPDVKFWKLVLCAKSLPVSYPNDALPPSSSEYDWKKVVVFVAL